MNKILSAIILVSLYVLPGCASKGPEQDPSIVPSSNTTTTTLISDSTKPAAAITVPAPVNKTNITPVISTATPRINTKTAAGLNPPHGQPGHQCELAVGAPLNSKPNTPVTTVTSSPGKTITTSPVKNLSNPITNSSGVRLNPAHGQPGHDCAIAVGQPLKNK